MACSSLALSEDAHFLLTATSRAIKVWNYWTQADCSCQVGAVGRQEALLSGASTGGRGDPCRPRRVVQWCSKDKEGRGVGGQ